MRTRERTRIRMGAVGLLVLVFAAGAVASASVSGGGTATVNTNTQGEPADLDEIGLTEEQKLAIDSLVAARQPQLDAIIGAALEEVQIVADSVNLEVRALLSADQIEAYERLRKGGSRMQAVRRTRTPSGELIVDTIR
ncbi:MAG: hypothetical protein ACR2QM_06310 [Longimicrobiales bacterium]